MKARGTRKTLALRILRHAGLAVSWLCLGAQQASAFKAEATWNPVNGAVGYKVYVGYDADLIGTPIDLGRPNVDTDGTMEETIYALRVGPTVHISMTAYSADGTESLLSNGRTLTYAQVAAIVDSDHDGLTDGQEDRNLNRRRDSGETDPRVADTDGDGISDGDEADAGTNPLDPGSVAYCTGPCASAIWIDAAQAVARYNGVMTADGRYTAGKDLDTKANALTSLQVFANTTTNALNGSSGDYAQYNVTLPTSGTWYLWARMYYPGSMGTNDANSFFVRVDAGPLRKLGNNKDKFRLWHWDGSGDVEVGGPLALNLGTLAAGTHKIYVEKREVYPVQPRLDVIMLTRTATYVPDDFDATAALDSGSALMAPATALSADEPMDDPATTTTTTLQPRCTSHEDCDDLVSCTVDRCDLDTGECVYFPFDELCDDGDRCNGLEACNVYDDCQYGTPLACDDGLICNGSETCDAELGCVAGTPPSCDDGTVCTDDQCVESLGGCKSFANDASCADGNACTNDRCTGSGCAYDQNAATCDDGLSCTAGDQCAAGVCSGHDQCARGFRCDAELDTCKAVPGDPDADGLSADSDPCPLDARNLCAGPVAIDAQTSMPVRINAYGGDAACGGVKVDCNGDVWMGDFGFAGPGRAFVCDGGAGAEACTIANVTDVFGCTSEGTQDLLRCARGGQSHGGTVTYRFDVPNGYYVVNLLFAGLDEVSDDGRADIVIEGAEVTSGLNPVALTGGPGRALVRAYVVMVRDGDGLEISLRPAGDRASINALEVLTLTR